MSDEKITPAAREAMREALLAEVLGDVGEMEKQVKAIHAELVETNKQLKEERRMVLDELRATGTAEKNKLASEAAKLVREGVFSETGELKREIGKVIIDFRRAAEEVKSARRWDFIGYVFTSCLAVAVATFIVAKVILTH